MQVQHRCAREPVLLHLRGGVLVLGARCAHSDTMGSHDVDSILFLTILAGVALSVLNLIVAIVNGSSSRTAEVKATAGIRELYQRTYNRGRRLVSITRTGKVERRKQPTSGPD